MKEKIDIELNTFIPLEEMNMADIESRYYSLFIKTEVFITKPEFVVPQIARIHKTQYYYYKGEALTQSAICDRTKRSLCAADLNSIVALEIWEDHGSDGHIEFQLVGYAFVLEKDINSFLQTETYPYRLASDLYWAWRKENTYY